MQYDDAVPQRQTTIVKPPAHWGWGLGRFLLLLASQLAIHRQQLYHIIKAHEERLAQGWWNVDSYRDHDMKYAETGAWLRPSVLGRSVLSPAQTIRTRTHNQTHTWGSVDQVGRPWRDQHMCWCTQGCVVLHISLTSGAWTLCVLCVCCCRVASAALMQQRIAGLVFCYDAWAKWYQQARTQLSDRMEEVNNKLKVGKEGADKGAKGAKEAMNAQQTKELNAELTEVRAQLKLQPPNG